MPFVSVIIPICNESENIPALYRQLKDALNQPHEILWIDDGSRDDSLQQIATLAKEDNSVKAISFSRNFGHQNAIFAGLHYAKGDWIVIMDGDLQHPPSLLSQLFQKLREGFDLVSGRRVKTEEIGWLKKSFTRLYYKLINYLSDTNIAENVADFRAFNVKVKDAICNSTNRNFF
jgi:dolichol-phosphate mannosyltransferase